MTNLSLELLRKQREKLFKSFKRKSGTPKAQDAYMKLLVIDLKIGELEKKGGKKKGGIIKTYAKGSKVRNPKY